MRMKYNAIKFTNGYGAKRPSFYIRLLEIGEDKEMNVYCLRLGSIISTTEARRCEYKILPLTLFKEFFDQILEGTKVTEYRQIKPYWTKRLFDTI